MDRSKRNDVAIVLDGEYIIFVFVPTPRSDERAQSHRETRTKGRALPFQYNKYIQFYYSGSERDKLTVFFDIP
jgi:hypothetical protein